MVLDYAELLTEVQELINVTGRTVTFSKLVASGADSDKPWKPTGGADPASEVSCKATFVPLASTAELGMNLTDDELFKRCSQVCLVAGGQTQDLSRHNLLSDGGVPYRIEAVKVLKPGSVVMLYAFGVMQ